MKQRSKLSPRQQQSEQQETLHETRQQAGQEFATAEELLRFDAKQTTVPPQIAERLKQAAQPAAPQRSWWQKLFGR